jgi:hypothetical protein
MSANQEQHGLHFADVRRVLPRSCIHYGFTPGSRYLVSADGLGLFALAPECPAEIIDLARFENPIFAVHPIGDEPTVLVQEGLPTLSCGWSSGDPMRFWWICGGTTRLLLGPEQDIHLAEVPVSPDRRYVALVQWRDRTDQDGRYSVVLLLDGERGMTSLIDLPNRSLAVVGWKGEGAGSRAVLATNRWKFDPEAPVIYLADPASSAWVADPDPSPTIRRLGGVVSPDGRLLAEIEGGKELMVVDLASGRSVSAFTFSRDFSHAEECMRWAGSCFLHLMGDGLMLIDAYTLEVNRPLAEPEWIVASARCCFSTDLAWVVYRREYRGDLGLYLGRLVLPQRGR